MHLAISLPGEVTRPDTLDTVVEGSHETWPAADLPNAAAFAQVFRAAVIAKPRGTRRFSGSYLKQ
jgi:hypothetical protein